MPRDKLHVKMDLKKMNTKQREFYFAFEYIFGNSRRLSLFGFFNV